MIIRSVIKVVSATGKHSTVNILEPTPYEAQTTPSYNASIDHATAHADMPAQLRRRKTISVEQSSCCSMKTKDVTVYFKATTEGLSVLHLNAGKQKERSPLLGAVVEFS